jgi:hypothetical protein
VRCEIVERADSNTFLSPLQGSLSVAPPALISVAPYRLNCALHQSEHALLNRAQQSRLNRRRVSPSAFTAPQAPQTLEPERRQRSDLKFVTSTGLVSPRLSVSVNIRSTS